MRRPIIFTVLLLATVPAVAQSMSVYLFDRLYQPRYSRAWSGLFAGQGSVPTWLATFAKTKNGVTTAGKEIMLEGHPVELFHVCKTHECGANDFEVMFFDNGGMAKGALVVNGGTPRFFGQPNAVEAAVLLANING